MTVGERIVEARKAKGISQKQLAEMTGIPVQTLLRYEKGGNLSVDSVSKLAKALEMTPSALIGWNTSITAYTHNMVEVLKENGAKNEDILSSFTTRELAEEIGRRSENATI